jgi:dTDP-4-dehydrorhamnose reductase
VVILRSSIILGRKAPILPEHAHDTFLHFCASRRGMTTDFYTNERRSVVSVDDVIASIQWFVCDYCCSSSSTKNDNGTITKTTTGIFNLGGPASVSRFDMARAVFEHLGYDPVHLVAKEKQQSSTTTYSPQEHEKHIVPSPLDISMDSTRIESVTGRTFEPLSSIVQKTFSHDNTTT